MVTSLTFVHNDHLGSVNVQTDSDSEVVRVLDYLPYGSKRISTGTDSSQREFLGQVEDPESSMNYLNARYLQNSRGQFVSQDPMFWALPAVLLVDPQQQNSYSYARNNPVNLSDPSGLLTMAVPGTKIKDKNQNMSSDWSTTKEGQKFLSRVEKTFGEKPIVFNWSGGNNTKAREAAAQRLADYVKDYKFADGEKLNIVGYSHGGNVGARFSQLTDRKIDNFVTLGTPVRLDYQPNYNMIGNHLNVYTPIDPVQASGGSIWSSDFEIGPAGRTFSNAKNLNVFYEAPVSPKEAHNLWQTPAVWGRVDAWAK